MADFKDRFKELRQQRKMSQRELAKELNLAYSLVGMYETGKRKPSRETLELMCDYFNVTMDYLLGKDDVTIRLLTPKELGLIDAYRAADVGIQSAVEKLLDIRMTCDEKEELKHIK